VTAADTGSGPSLHPLLAHHVVNSLGWPSLRPLQQQAVAPLQAGEHALLIAPTAGGKTEAAMFPIFSRMLAEDWSGLSVLYLCPLRALLNNLHPRLRGYADLIGRRVGLWHGDIGEGERQRIRRDPPDVLLTTPESVEAMLMSSKTDHAWLFRDVRAFVVDEIHAFAGDDRGWHLLSVMQRLQQLSGREPQRIGLSATVGEPEALLGWLTRGTAGRRRLLLPPAAERPRPDITLDHVGTLANAAIVLSRLHRGEKRLVFVDSRARAEELTRELRLHGTDVWLSHGSLGREERHAAEDAFASAPAGVIVATSTMELGIDVGDLDRVVQIDAPWTVASFLQRLGRTGRRADTIANCLFLSTSDRALRDTLGLLTAWSHGHVEPVEPPPYPAHVLVQQLLALLRQEGAQGRHVWRSWLGESCVLGDDVAADVDAIVEHLLAVGLLDLDGDLLQLGPEAERRYGRRNYLDLTAVFADPPTLAVTYGRSVIGQVHVRSLMRRDADDAGPRLLLIAGRDWVVEHVDWKRRQVRVTPATQRGGRTGWVGGGSSAGGVGMSAVLAAATREALAGADPDGVRVSKRARAALADLRAEFDWLDDDATHLVSDETGATWWWTFAGTDANVELAHRLGGHARSTSPGGLAIRVEDAVSGRELLEAARTPDDGPMPNPSDIAEAWKFADALPAGALLHLVDARMRDHDAVARTTALPVRRHRFPDGGPRP
jgi:ATP-dependent helicase Lhr and Lhr-like helicase